MKKNNKGFSLVELIVILLIMGILAVALTPQVMKWVDKSRIAADKDTFEAVKAAAALAYTSDSVYGKGTTKITLSQSAGSLTGTANTGFSTKFTEYAGGDISSFKFKKNYTAILEYDTNGVLTNVSLPSDLSDALTE